VEHETSSFSQRKEKLNATYKVREEWWSRVFASPAAHYALCIVADWRILTPNRLTVFSFLLTIGVASLVLFGSTSALPLAAILLQLAYVMDCMDGQLARYRGNTSEFGSFLDKILDYLKFPFLLFALTLEAFNRSHSYVVLILGFGCLFFTCFLPYLKSLAKTEFNVESWRVLVSNEFLERNLRFFLFEEEVSCSTYFSIGSRSSAC